MSLADLINGNPEPYPGPCTVQYYKGKTLYETVSVNVSISGSRVVEGDPCTLTCSLDGEASFTIVFQDNYTPELPTPPDDTFYFYKFGCCVPTDVLEGHKTGEPFGSVTASEDYSGSPCPDDRSEDGDASANVSVNGDSGPYPTQWSISFAVSWNIDGLICLGTGLIGGTINGLTEDELLGGHEVIIEDGDVTATFTIAIS